MIGLKKLIKKCLLATVFKQKIKNKQNPTLLYSAAEALKCCMQGEDEKKRNTSVVHAQASF